MSTDIEAIQLEEDSELAGVAFVRDYIEFYFDGPILRALIDPTVTIGNHLSRSSDEGWRNTLCSLIGKKIKTLSIEENATCELVFVSGEIVSIDLATGEAESVHFVRGPNQPLQVW
jgi:hypothetical protein